MSSLSRRSLSKKFKLYPYPYTTQADIKGLTAKEIMLLPLSEVNPDIANNTGGVRLTDEQIKALNYLLAMKRHKPKITQVQQYQMVQRRINENREVANLMTETNTSIMLDAVNTKQMENGLRRLNDMNELSYTPEERVFMSKVFKGGRKTKRRRTNKRRTHKRQTK
jgi:hypothetical protein